MCHSHTAQATCCETAVDLERPVPPSISGGCVSNVRVIVLYVLLHTAGLLPLLCPQCRCAPSSSTEPCSRRISLTFDTHVPGGGQRRAGGLHPEPALLHPRERGEGGAAGPPRGAGTRGRTVRVRLPPPRRVRRRRGAVAGQAGGARGCGRAGRRGRPAGTWRAGE